MQTVLAEATTHSARLRDDSIHPAARDARHMPVSREVELDFLRGIAILLVMDFHSPHALLSGFFDTLGYSHLGWIGVDIFFVLSGFLVGGLLIKEWEVRRGIDIKRFLLRRSFKIFPQYYVFLAVVLLTGHHKLSFVLGNLFDLQNYFGGISHTWSLAVEEHAYLLLVLCLALASRRRMSPRQLFAVLCALCVLVTTVRYGLSLQGQKVFETTHTRLEAILYGVLLAMMYHFKPTLFERMRSFKILWLGSLAITLELLKRPVSSAWWPALHRDAADLFAISLLMLLYNPHDRSGRLWQPYRVVAWIGVQSYGIYLWHVSVIAPITEFGRHFPAVPGPVLGFAVILAAIAVGTVTTRSRSFACETACSPSASIRLWVFPQIPSTSARSSLLAEAGLGIELMWATNNGAPGLPEVWNCSKRISMFSSAELRRSSAELRHALSALDLPGSQLRARGRSRNGRAFLSGPLHRKRELANPSSEILLIAQTPDGEVVGTVQMLPRP